MNKIIILSIISLSLFSAGSVYACACYSNSECGVDVYVGSPFCQGGNVYQNYILYTCNNPGTASSSCTNNIVAQLKTSCTSGQACSNGSCTGIVCSNDSDCGTSRITGALFCQNGDVYQNYISYTCNNPGTASSYCANSTTAQLQIDCVGNQTCSNGCCVTDCTNHSYKQCDGNSVYWFDSCGKRQGIVQYCPNGCSGNSCIENYCTNNSYKSCVGSSLYWFDSCGKQQGIAQYCPNGCSGSQCQSVGTLTVTKTVRNLTSGSGFSTSAYANPSDMLMFMITLQSANQDVQNVFVRDSLPANLIYSNQLVVARPNNAYGNYSGDILSGINLNTIPAGQTVTITYQTQVASVANFSYGTTTLNNNVNVISSVYGNLNAMASVVVTRSAVLGASTIATGLTNNFWLDSFVLPLLVVLIIIVMWRSGVFFGVEKWFDNKKKIRRNYHAEKELSNRIKQIAGR